MALIMYLHIYDAGQGEAFRKNFPVAIHHTSCLQYFLDTHTAPSPHSVHDWRVGQYSKKFSRGGGKERLKF